MSNPYQSPAFDPKQFQDYSTPFPPPQNTGFGWVQQIRVVAILNCVQGGLELLMGLMMVSAAFFVPVMMKMDKQNPLPPEMEWVLPVVYLGIGIPVLLSAILRIYAGIQNFRYRKRVLGIVSFVCGMVSLIACYCAPTGIAMIIYGLIAYLNPAVQTAFEMGEKGIPPDAILNSFLPYPPQQYGQPPTYGQSPFTPPPSPPQV